MRTLEICVDNFVSVEAAMAGADRLELCQNLAIGGLTPTAGFITVVKKMAHIPVFVLIRPRPGNFEYSALEVEQMIQDIKISIQCGADGFVFGALTDFTSIDSAVCRKLIDAASGLPVTFHRAFDDILDKSNALEQIIALGFQRLLTSGTFGNATDGIIELHKLVLQAESRIIIMPGGGINDTNIQNVAQLTGAQEIHSSGRQPIIGDTIFKTKFCCKEMVCKMKKALNS